jgi:hypothetical protein
MTLTSGSRRFVLVMAHIALVVLVVQIVAIDHWHADSSDAEQHARHCHGTSSSCADGGALTPASLNTALTPLPPEPRLHNDPPSITSHADAFVAALREPPRDA